MWPEDSLRILRTDLSNKGVEMSNSKRLFKKCIIGFISGILLGLIITVIFSIQTPGGRIGFVNPDFAGEIGNLPVALLIQSVLTGLLGVVGYGGSEVYRIDNWSILKATTIHFGAVIVVFFAIGFSLHWMSVDDGTAILIMLGIYILVYAALWIIQYLRVKSQVRDINSGLEKMKKGSRE